jgi:hypothetical protein
LNQAFLVHAATIESVFNRTPDHAAKFNLLNSNFFGTVWHKQSHVVIGFK